MYLTRLESRILVSLHYINSGVKEMKQSVKTVLSTLQKQYYKLNKPYYYKYAQDNIQCDCPLCRCPSRNTMRYSFVYICEKRNLIYYDVPKCASSTIRKVLFNNGHQLSLQNPQKDLQKYFKFSFVRNPWNRIVSNWKMFTTQSFRIEQLKSMTSQDVSKFEDFVYFADSMKNHHWQPQILYLPDQLDFVGKLESFNEDFSNLCNTIGEKPHEIKKINSITKLPYWEYYTPSLVEFVSEMYAEDIKKFGYKFGE